MLDEAENHEVRGISKDVVRKTLKKMKNRKSAGPDYIPVEAWKCLEEKAVELTRLIYKILESERMPDKWRSVLFQFLRAREMHSK